MNVDASRTTTLPEVAVARRWRTLGWWVMALLSIWTAVLSFRFLFLQPEALYPEVPEGRPDVGGIARHFIFLLEERWLRFASHFVAAPIALLVGPFQFLDRLRAARPRLHRALGYVYAVGVAVGGVGGLVLSLGSFGGLSTHFGFGTLALIWLACTGLAVWHARHRRFAVHRQWMMRSFALTFAAVTLRLYIPLLMAFGVPFEEVYQTVAWFSWVPNLLVVELFLLPRRPSASV